MKNPYDTLVSLIEMVTSQIHDDDGVSLTEHVASLISHVPPSNKQARTLFDVLFIDNSVITSNLAELRQSLLRACEPWINPDDPWYWDACRSCIKANDAHTLDFLLSQPGAPSGSELSSKPFTNHNEGMLALVIRTHPPGMLWDVMHKYGADFSLPCLAGGGLPVSYQPGAVRTSYLMERGARLAGTAPDGKPIWPKVFRIDLDPDTLIGLLHCLSTPVSMQAIQKDLQNIWPELLPWIGAYLARKPYLHTHLSILKALKQFSFATGLTMGGNQSQSSVLAHWAHAMLLHYPDEKSNGLKSPRPLWKDLMTILRLDNAWDGQIVVGKSDGIWGLFSDIQSTDHAKLTEEDIATFIGKDPATFWADLEAIVLENSQHPWVWDGVSRLRPHMPAEVRASTCNATGKAFFRVLQKDPGNVSRNPRGGISVLSQCLKSLSNERDEFVDQEMVSMALAAHFLIGWQSKAAIKALERLARDPPEWLDVPMIMEAYRNCPRKFKGGEARNLEAWLVSLNTERAPPAQSPSRRL